MFVWLAATDRVEATILQTLPLVSDACWGKCVTGGRIVVAVSPLISQ